MHANSDAAGAYISMVKEIIKAEKTCLLGNDLPCVFFGMTGGRANFSYGRGRLTRYLKTDTTIKPSSGMIIEYARDGLEVKHIYSINIGYMINMVYVAILFKSSSFFAAPVFSRNWAVIFMYVSFFIILILV